MNRKMFIVQSITTKILSIQQNKYNSVFSTFACLAIKFSNTFSIRWRATFKQSKSNVL